MISAGKTIEPEHEVLVLITQAIIHSVFIEHRSRLAKILNCNIFLPIILGAQKHRLNEIWDSPFCMSRGCQSKFQ